MANAPTVELENSIYYTAFNELDTERRFENGPIPWGSINDYMTVFEFSPDQREFGFEIIRQVDRWLRAELAKRRKQAKTLGEGDKEKRGLGGNKKGL